MNHNCGRLNLFMLWLMTLSGAHTIYIDREEAAVAYLKVLSRHLPEGTEDCHENMTIFGFRADIRICYFQNTSSKKPSALASMFGENGICYRNIRPNELVSHLGIPHPASGSRGELP